VTDDIRQTYTCLVTCVAISTESFSVTSPNNDSSLICIALYGWDITGAGSRSAVND